MYTYVTIRFRVVIPLKVPKKSNVGYGRSDF
jgi:hypothetical protein